MYEAQLFHNMVDIIVVELYSLHNRRSLEETYSSTTLSFSSTLVDSSRSYNIVSQHFWVVDMMLILMIWWSLYCVDFELVVFLLWLVVFWKPNCCFHHHHLLLTLSAFDFLLVLQRQNQIKALVIYLEKIFYPHRSFTLPRTKLCVNLLRRKSSFSLCILC